MFQVCEQPSPPTPPVFRGAVDLCNMSANIPPCPPPSPSHPSSLIQAARVRWLPWIHSLLLNNEHFWQNLPRISALLYMLWSLLKTSRFSLDPDSMSQHLRPGLVCEGFSFVTAWCCGLKLTKLSEPRWEWLKGVRAIQPESFYSNHHCIAFVADPCRTGSACMLEVYL